MVSIHTLLHATRTNHANKPGVAVEHGLTDVDKYACIDWPACGALFACMLTFGFVLCLGPAIAAMDAASVVLFVSAMTAPPLVAAVAAAVRCNADARRRRAAMDGVLRLTTSSELSRFARRAAKTASAPPLGPTDSLAHGSGVWITETVTSGTAASVIFNAPPRCVISHIAIATLGHQEGHRQSQVQEILTASGCLGNVLLPWGHYGVYDGLANDAKHYTDPSRYTAVRIAIKTDAVAFKLSVRHRRGTDASSFAGCAIFRAIGVEGAAETVEEVAAAAAAAEAVVVEEAVAAAAGASRSTHSALKRESVLKLE